MSPIAPTGVIKDKPHPIADGCTVMSNRNRIGDETVTNAKEFTGLNGVPGATSRLTKFGAPGGSMRVLKKPELVDAFGNV
jgi:hypothetical protein